MKIALLLGAFLLVACSFDVDEPASDPEPNTTETRSPGNLSARLYLLGPDQATASTFAEGVSITAVYEIVNRGDTADCTVGNSGPIVSFDLYEGETEIASSTRGKVYATVITPFEITEGTHFYGAELQNLTGSGNKRVEMLLAGAYTLVAQPLYSCGQEESLVRLEAIEYAFTVTK